MEFLEERSQQSKKVKLWVDVVIKPMFITMAYIRAEREGNWLLHLAAFRQMIPYFFAAGHFNLCAVRFVLSPFNGETAPECA